MSDRHKYPYEAQQEINDLERQLAEAREELSKEEEFIQIVIDANEQYINKYNKSLKEVIELKILVLQERYENQENKLSSVRVHRSHERVMEEEKKLNDIAKEINKLKEQLKEKGGE